MESMWKEPSKSIWLACGSRSEAKAAYRMLGNEKLKDENILDAHIKRTVKRIEEAKSNITSLLNNQKTP